jgi:hypothetical protein
MKNSIIKILTITTFSFLLNSTAIAGEDVDALTLSFQNNTQEIMERDAVFKKVSFNNSYIIDSAIISNVLDINYDSVK